MTSEIRSKALRGQFDEKVNIAEPQSEVRKVGERGENGEKGTGNKQHKW